jgi:hypothetical protein
MLEVHGHLTDDNASPVRSKAIQFSSLQTSLQFLACKGSSTRIETDEDGRVCVVVSNATQPFAVTATFKQVGAMDGTAETLQIDPGKKSLTLRIAPTPIIIPLDVQLWHLEVLVSSHEGPVAVPEENIPLQLLDETGRDLASQTTSASGKIDFQVSPEKLGPPGAGSLSVVYAGNASIAPVTVRYAVERRAKVSISLLDDALKDGVPTRFRLSWRGGPIATGAVEATLDGLSLGSAPVQPDALSILKIQLPDDTPESASAVLRYVQTERFLEPGTPLSVKVTPRPLGTWLRYAAGFFAIMVLVWTFGTRLFRKGARAHAHAKPSSGTLGAGPVTVVHKQGEALVPRWDGRILDAHTGAPVAYATVALRPIAFTAKHPVVETRSNEAGEFSLTCAQSPAGHALFVYGELHAETPLGLPAFGTLVIRVPERRRKLLDAFVAKMQRRFPNEREPTPGAVRRNTNASGESAWAARVEVAAFSGVRVNRDVEVWASEAAPTEPPEVNTKDKREPLA